MAKYRRITEEQRTTANSTDLYSFLTSHGEQLQRHGSGYKLVYTENGQKHDSITINGNQWYDHKNQIGGGAIKFGENYYGSSYPEAVEMLLGFSSVPSSNITRVSNVNTQLPIRKEFKLPKANSDMKRVFAYLTKTRHISGDIVSFFAHKKMIYESLEYYNDKTTGEQKEAHNVVFLGRDKEGTAKQANKRSIATYGKSFRMTVSGSDTNFSFCHIGTDDMAIVPMQDLLGLDSKARINIPSTTGGNWQWRATPEQIDNKLAKKLHKCMQMYARLREEPEEASDKSDAKETADTSTSKTAGCEKKAAK